MSAVSVLGGEARDTVMARVVARSERVIEASKTRFDAALLRYDAWFLIFVAVVLGLGATIFAGLVVWCVVYKGKRFTGRWSFRNFGLSVYAECV